MKTLSRRLLFGLPLALPAVVAASGSGCPSTIFTEVQFVGGGGHGFLSTGEYQRLRSIVAEKLRARIAEQMAENAALVADIRRLERSLRERKWTEAELAATLGII